MAMDATAAASVPLDVAAGVAALGSGGGGGGGHSGLWQRGCTMRAATAGGMSQASGAKEVRTAHAVLSVRLPGSRPN